jgi:hypothetical protein
MPACPGTSTGLGPVDFPPGWLIFSHAFLSRSFQRGILNKISHFWIDTSLVFDTKKPALMVKTTKQEILTLLNNASH